MWTKTPPTEPGYYWHRKDGETRVVHVYNSCGLPFDVTFHGTPFVERADRLRGEFWSEPIKPPEE